MRDLWHAAGRAAGDRRKRRMALLGVLWSAPVLLLGALLSRLLADPAHAFEGLGAPLGYVLGPARAAYAADADLALLGYLVLQGLLLVLVWGLFGGALHRLAAVDLTQGREEQGAAALRFARRHWRGFVGSKAGLLAASALPLAAAVVLPWLGRLAGPPLGGVLLALGVLLGVVLVAFGVFMAACWLTAGFLTTPVIACEDSHVFDALSRTFGYAGKGLPRLTLWRLAFLGGVLIGVLWRGLRLALTVGVLLAVLRWGAGEAALDRVHAILRAGGAPPDAERLGLTWGDGLAAFAFALVLFALLATWLADAVSRVACARTAVYLALRERIDGTPRSTLGSAPEAPAFQDAGAAGFQTVARVDDRGA